MANGEGLLPHLYRPTTSYYGPRRGHCPTESRLSERHSILVAVYLEAELTAPTKKSKSDAGQGGHGNIKRQALAGIKAKSTLMKGQLPRRDAGTNLTAPSWARYTFFGCRRRSRTERPALRWSTLGQGAPPARLTIRNPYFPPGRRRPPSLLGRPPRKWRPPHGWRRPIRRRIETHHEHHSRRQPPSDTDAPTVRRDRQAKQRKQGKLALRGEA